MPQQRITAWVVFALCAGAYIPMAIGGWEHPEENNVASYGLWLILALMLLFSSLDQGFAGWRMPLGFAIGNFGMLLLAVARGCTFNLGPAETYVFFGLITTICIWIVVGQKTGKWNSRILFLGGIAADVLSFYPQIKQYIQPHEPPTTWMLVGWGMWIAGAMVNVLAVEKLLQKIHTKTSTPSAALEESAFSIENGLLMLITMAVMLR